MKRSFAHRLQALFTRSTREDEAFFEELEDVLLAADLGASLALEITDELRAGGRAADAQELRRALRDRLAAILKPAVLSLSAEALNVVLVLGVNGVGKTTTIAKLVHRRQRTDPGSGQVIAAADTFRAAAPEQLSRHAARLGVRTVSHGTGADPAAVVYDAIESALARNEAIVWVDTAGRTHNRQDLIRQLEKIDRVLGRFGAASVTGRRLLVLDATTGQNAVQQARAFSEAVAIDAIVLCKYDAGARGGALAPIARSLDLGCAFLGTGESYDDLATFDPERFIERLMDAE